MTDFQFTKATRKRSKLRLAIDGPSGSGKTYTGLVAATVMANGGRIAVIDTERGSASLYSDKFEFDVLELDTFSPEVYTRAIEAAERAGYTVIVIDSLSHAWEGEGGALDMVDQAAARLKGNSYVAWKDVTPLHRKMVDAMLQSPAHIIVTMRSKMDYVQDKDERGKTTIRKVGMAPIQRQGMEYEFTIVADMDVEHTLMVSKSRCDIVDKAVIKYPGAEFFQTIQRWLNSGEAPTSRDEKTITKELGYDDPNNEQAQSLGAPEYLEDEHPENPANGRPYSPEVLREKLSTAAQWYDSRKKTATDKDRKVLAAQLGTLFGGDDTKRYEATKYIAGVASTKDLSDGMVKAMLGKWLEVDTFGQMPNLAAMDEAKSLTAAALTAAGQQELL